MLMNNIQPRINLISPEQLALVHASSLHILSTIGVRVDSARARQLFEASDYVRMGEEGRAYLQPELVEWALKAAPGVVDVYNRRGEPAFRLGADRTRFGVGVTNLYYQDPLSEAVEPFTRAHLSACVRLGGALKNFDVVSTIGILHDEPPQVADLYAVLEMVANTVKTLVILISDEALFPPALDLLERLHGDLSARPFVIPYLNPVTPLIINEGTSDKMLASIDRGLPFIYSNYGMAGMSTPITPVGTLALLNAELLAGLVLSQLYREGAAVILGSLPAYFDMKSMVDFYDPRTALINLACAELMAYYGLPHAGTSGSGNGWGADLIETGTLWTDLLTGCLGKVGLAPFVGGALASKAFSPATVVYADELIAQARDFAAGFSLDDESLALDEMAEAIEEGHFLTTPQTRRLFKGAYAVSGIFPRWGLENWQENGSPQAIDYLKEKTRELLAGSPPPEDQEELVRRGEEFIANLDLLM
jgi:trimethylamine--corrinoid protein Co-methyltransferase